MHVTIVSASILIETSRIRSSKVTLKVIPDAPVPLKRNGIAQGEQAMLILSK